MIVCFCALPSGVGAGVCAEYLDLYWSRAAWCVAAVLRCMRRVVDTLWIRFSIARLPAGIQ